MFMLLSRKRGISVPLKKLVTCPLILPWTNEDLGKGFL